ncbi:hypothetical protein C8Q70DRAFT_312494 [Cubamyces menziesii]|nr:hypothetical protein C8Q70DRAFT_312494 [Cubamyces menziesii]
MLCITVSLLCLFRAVFHSFDSITGGPMDVCVTNHSPNPALALLPILEHLQPTTVRAKGLLRSRPSFRHSKMKHVR